MTVPDEPASLTRQEVACLKTALALVIVKRRVLEEKEKQSNNNKRARLELVPGLEDRTPPLQGNERWAQHVTHMMDLARNEQQQQADNITASSVSGRHHRHLARLESLATHVACQLAAWFKEPTTSSDRTTTRTHSLLLGVLDEKETPTHVAPVQQWIQSQLTHPHDDDDEHLWLLILRAQPIVMAQLLIPVLCELLLSQHNKNTAAADLQSSVAHWCNLMHAAIRQAPAETCREALALWAAATTTTTTTTTPSVHDLASHYHYHNASGGGTQLLWLCAAADLVQELLARLSQLGTYYDAPTY